MYIVPVAAILPVFLAGAHTPTLPYIPGISIHTAIVAVGLMNPLKTAVPFGGQTTWNLAGSSPKTGLTAVCPGTG